MPTNLQTKTHIADKDLAERICRWEPEAWEQFRERFDARLLRTAIAWCGPACRNDCPGYGCNIRHRPQINLVCPVAFDAYTFILEAIVRRLAAYRGECSLDSWVYVAVTPHASTHHDARRFDYRKLFADYLRSSRRRVQPPACLKDLSRPHHNLFLLLSRGVDLADAARKMDITAEQAEQQWTAIADRLKGESYGLYWVHLVCPAAIDCPVSLDAPTDGESAASLSDCVVSAEPDPHVVAEARAYLALLRHAISQQSPMDQAILALRYDRSCVGDLRCPMEARGIASALAMLGDGETTMTEQAVYGRLRTIRARLVRRLSEALKERTSLTEAGMDAILDEWGAGCGDMAGRILAACTTKTCTTPTGTTVIKSAQTLPTH